MCMARLNAVVCAELIPLLKSMAENGGEFDANKYAEVRRGTNLSSTLFLPFLGHAAKIAFLHKHVGSDSHSQGCSLVDVADYNG